MIRECDRDASRMRYYDLSRNWTRKIMPHLGDGELNEILVRDFNRFTHGRWGQRFGPGEFPRDYETCDWDIGHPGRPPRYWAYVKHAACHWLVNFNLRLAGLAEPRRPWRILTSERHSTVWDGDRTLFDLNFSAFGISPQECFESARVRELPVGKYRRCGLAEHWREEQERLARESNHRSATSPAGSRRGSASPGPRGRPGNPPRPTANAGRYRRPKKVARQPSDRDHAKSNLVAKGSPADGLRRDFSRIGVGTDPDGAGDDRGVMPRISRRRSR